MTANKPRAKLLARIHWSASVLLWFGVVIGSVAISISAAGSRAEAFSPLVETASLVAPPRRRAGAAASSPLFSSRHKDDEKPPPAQRPYAAEARTAETKADRPTQTAIARITPPSLPAKPKIVVLGATGRIGRHVVRNLLSTGADVTVVAFVRNYDKALEVLFDGADGDEAVVRRKNRRGPRLEIVVGDLVPRHEVYGYRDEDDELELEFNATTLASVRRFYGDGTADDVYRASLGPSKDEESAEALREAVKGCTAIISCVGTVRPTNPWTDFVVNPLRIFRLDASRWCTDPTHPYYVNYCTTRTVLDLAEREQLRREAEIEEYDRAEQEIAESAAKMGKSYVPASAMGKGDSNNRRRGAERIKFVRISDLAVTYRPWGLVSVVTNLCRSLVFRDQDRSEKMLEESSVVDTIILRPGDLTDEKRNATTTSLQVDASGLLPSPAVVSREDVAALAVSAALTRHDGTNAVIKDDGCIVDDVSGEEVKKRKRKDAYQSDKKAFEGARSYTWAVRWVGSHLDQGRKRDGLPDAQTCVDRILRVEARRAKRNRMLERIRDADTLQRYIAGISKPLRKRRMKPYGVFVAVPVYLVMAAIFFSALRNVPGKEAALEFIVRRLTLR